MSLAHLLRTQQYDNLVKGRLDTFLIREMQDRDEDRRWDVNSPSSIGDCSRKLFYSRMGIKGHSDDDPKSKRILDNGTYLHERMENYLLKAEIAILNEIPVDHRGYNIIGHGDLLITPEEYEGRLTVAFEYQVGKDKAEDWIIPKILSFDVPPIPELIVGEIKSINLRGYEILKDAKEEHKFQAMSYLLALEEERLMLRKRFKTKEKLLEHFNSKAYEEYFLELYGHLKTGSKFTRVEKLNNKFKTLVKRDMLLWSTTAPINRMTFIYECKNDQEIKEFTVEQDEALTQGVIDFVTEINEAVAEFKAQYRKLLWKKQGRVTQKEKEKLLDLLAPPKAGTSKSNSPCRWCKYVGRCHIL